MASKTTYETVFELGAKIESSMGKAFGKAQKSINKLEKHTKVATKTTKGLSSALKVAGVAAVAYKVFGDAKRFLNDASEAATLQIEVETKLATVLQERTDATRKQIQSILDLTSVQQNLGVIGDEIQIAGSQQLATFINQTESIETLLPAMNNLLAQQKGLSASTGDAVNIGNLMGKVMQGQTGALTRVGVSFTDAQEKVLKFGTEQERAVMLAQVITDNVGNMNEALAQTDSGKIKNATNRLGDMKEIIGKKILPIQAKFYSWFAKKIPKIQSFVLNMIDKVTSGVDWIKNTLKKVSPVVKEVIRRFTGFNPVIVKIIDTVKWLKDIGVDAFNNIKGVIEANGPTLTNIKDKIVEIASNINNGLNSGFNAAKPILEWLFTEGLPQVVDFLIQVVDKATVVYEFIVNNWSAFEPIVYGIIAAFVAYQAITIILSVITGVATGALTALGVAMAFVTSPIGIVVLAIGALIAIGVLLYKNWDKIKAFIVKIALKIKEGIIKAFNNVIAFLKEWGPLILAVITGPFGMAIYAIVKNWDTIKIFFSELLQSIKDIFSGIGAWFGDTFNAAADGIKSAISGIGDFFGGMFDSVVESVKGNINILIGIFNFMIDKVNSVQVTIPEWVPEVGGETMGFNIPNIPQLAEGGIIKRRPGGILANIGEGRYDEMVMPLNRNRVNGLLGSKAQKTNQNATTTIHYKPTIIIQGNADESVVKRALDEAKREFKKEYEAMMLKNKRLQFA